MLTYDPLIFEAIILNSIFEVTILCSFTEKNNQMNVKVFVVMERVWFGFGFKQICIGISTLSLLPSVSLGVCDLTSLKVSISLCKLVMLIPTA